MSIQELAKSIADHAATGPSTVPGQMHRNSLSPHFERMVGELIRAYLITHTKDTILHVEKEFDSLLPLSPEGFVGQVQLTKTRVNGLIHHMCK